MFLDIDDLVDLIDVILEVDLLTVEDDLLVVDQVEIFVLDREDSEHVGPWEGLEIVDGQHVHHLAFDQLTPVEILLRYLGKAEGLLELGGELGIEFDLL
jgi:hypothetical protein